MKKLYYLLLMVLPLLTMTSCSDDDSETVTDSSSIVGKWVPDRTQVNGIAIEYEHGTCGKDYIEFKDDGTFEFVEIDNDCDRYIQEGTYTVSGSTLEMTSGEASNEGTYTVMNNILTFSDRYDYNGDGDVDDVVETYERL